MLQHILVVAAILLLCRGEEKIIQKDPIFCHDAENPLDFNTVIGTWQMVATIEPADSTNVNKNESYPCLASEFIGMLREYSRDLMMEVEGAETLYLRDVEEGNGLKTTRGCYQKVKNLNEGVFDYHAAKYIDLMMMQLYLVESSELLLVQNVWHTIFPGRIALVYAKSLENNLSEKDLQPAMDLITKISGKPQSLEFCFNESIENNELPLIPKLSKT